MATRKPARVWLILAVAVVMTAFIAWLSGFLYWQLRISRAIEELRRGPGTYETELFYANPDLLQIGGRGIPRILGELEDALMRGDEDQAFAFTCGLTDLGNGAMEVNARAAASSGSYERTRPRLSMDEMKTLVQEYRENWSEFYQQVYSPWWMWWDGRSHGF
jgi:hypothetical protein